MISSFLFIWYFLFPQNTDLLFKQGVEHYENQEIQKALEIFTHISERYPHHITASHNRALCYLRLNEKGLGLALLRRVLYLNPRYQNSLDTYTELINKSDFPRRKKSFYFSMQWKIPWFFVFALFSLSLLLFGLSLSRQSRQSIRIGLGLFLLFACGLLFSKIHFHLLPLGTVLKNASVVSVPGAEASLFEVFEGEEVKILQSHENFIQLENHEGFKGWIKDSGIFQHWGKEKLKKGLPDTSQESRL